MAKKKLTPKQQRFVDEYLIDLNGKQAAIRAGYAEKTAEVQASRLFSNAKVAEAVEKAKQERSERTKIDADAVLQESWEAWQVCKRRGDYRTGKGFLELVGKHVDVQAFKERAEIDSGDKLKEFLDQVANSPYGSLQARIANGYPGRKNDDP